MFSKGNRNVINIISGIATTGVAIGSLALVIVLSAFNGLEQLVQEMYTSFDPAVKISPAKGKTIGTDTFPVAEIRQLEGVEMLVPVLEETVFLQYGEDQTIATVKGVSPEYLTHLKLDKYVIDGDLTLEFEGRYYGFMGYGLADNLNLFVHAGFEPIRVYAAKRDAANSINPANKFNVERIMPSGIVAVNPDFDYKYMFTSYDFTANLLDYKNAASHFEIVLTEGAQGEKVKAAIQNLLGPSYEVKTRMELNEVLFKTNKTEKWVTFLILSFILVVATFNLVGSLTMLIIDKKQDILLLHALGAERNTVRNVFLGEGLLITLLGASIGIGLGSVLVLAQQYIGFFPLQGGIVEYYPVALRVEDLLAIIGIVGLIGLGASWLPVKYTIGRYLPESF